jgi:hypothetical protein
VPFPAQARAGCSAYRCTYLDASTIERIAVIERKMARG